MGCEGEPRGTVYENSKIEIIRIIENIEKEDSRSDTGIEGQTEDRKNMESRELKEIDILRGLLHSPFPRIDWVDSENLWSILKISWEQSKIK